MVAAGQQFPKGIKFQLVRPTSDNHDILACGIPTVYKCDKEFKDKCIVIVGVPGAFTPTCTANHIPPFLANAGQFRSKGVDQIIVISANDAFVLSAWAKALGSQAKNNADQFVMFASDPNSAFAKTIGYDIDLANRGMGTRNARFAMIVVNGKIVYTEREPAQAVTVSGADAVLSKL